MKRTALTTVRNRAETTLRVALFSFVLATGALTLASYHAHALYRQAADTTEYTLKRVFKEGDVDRYKLAVHTTINAPQAGGEVNIDLTLTMKETTKEVKPDGAVKLVEEFEEAHGKFTSPMGEQEADLKRMMPKITQIRDKKGAVDVKTEGGNAMLSGQIAGMIENMARAEIASLPSKAVKVGESWKIESNPEVEKATGGKTTGDVTLISTETIDGIKTLKLKAVTDTEVKEQGGGKMRGEVVSNVDARTGKAVRLTSKADGEVGGNKISATVEARLVTGDDKKAGAAEKKPEATDKKP
jgi:hypothetical protein